MNVARKLMLASVCMGLGVMANAFAPGSSRAGAPDTGDLHRDYYFAEAKETIPYRLYVPKSYDGTKPYPLIVVLHGSSTTADDVIKVAGLESEAEARNVILLAPQGYNAFGGYGDIYPVIVTREAASQADALRAASMPGANPPKGMTKPATQQPATPDDFEELPLSMITDPRVSRLSEKDTMNVLTLVRKDYSIDSSRIYLMGNSMGGGGAAYLAARYPQIWAAIAPSAGPFAAWSYPYFRLRENHIAALFVHGDKDQYANWKWSKAIVDQAKKEGVDAHLLVVKGGDHVDAWRMAIPQIFDFLLGHSKAS
jgi:predicted peptidase